MKQYVNLIGCSGSVSCCAVSLDSRCWAEWKRSLSRHLLVRGPALRRRWRECPRRCSPSTLVPPRCARVFRGVFSRRLARSSRPTGRRTSQGCAAAATTPAPRARCSSSRRPSPSSTCLYPRVEPILPVLTTWLMPLTPQHADAVQRRGRRAVDARPSPVRLQPFWLLRRRGARCCPFLRSRRGSAKRTGSFLGGCRGSALRAGAGRDALHMGRRVARGGVRLFGFGPGGLPGRRSGDPASRGGSDGRGSRGSARGGARCGGLGVLRAELRECHACRDGGRPPGDHGGRTAFRCLGQNRVVSRHRWRRVGRRRVPRSYSSRG